jgi:hypothetical protein
MYVSCLKIQAPCSLLVSMLMLVFSIRLKVEVLDQWHIKDEAREDLYMQSGLQLPSVAVNQQHK